MADVDNLLARLGDGADFGPGAVGRLEARLGLERAPLMIARRRRRLMLASMAVVAMISGGIVGGALESSQTTQTAVLLPASQVGTAAALLFGRVS